MCKAAIYMTRLSTILDNRNSSLYRYPFKYDGRKHWQSYQYHRHWYHSFDNRLLSSDLESAWPGCVYCQYLSCLKTLGIRLPCQFRRLWNSCCTQKQLNVHIHWFGLEWQPEPGGDDVHGEAATRHHKSVQHMCNRESYVRTSHKWHGVISNRFMMSYDYRPTHELDPTLSR